MFEAFQFEVVTRLRVNMSKSEIIPIGLMVDRHYLGCQVDFLPTTYLGLPLGAKYKDICCLLALYLGKIKVFVVLYNYRRLAIMVHIPHHLAPHTSDFGHLGL